jgi:uncharacterized protein
VTDTPAQPGRQWIVAKLRPDGSVATRYDAWELPAPPDWILVEAHWVHGRVDIGCFVFEPGDVLLEYFSLDRHYNAFATYRQSGEFVAWYCNVTYPTIVTDSELHWHDLYIDVIVLADGTVLVLDEDELEESALLARDPQLHATILAARDELLAMIEHDAYPFNDVRERYPAQ